MTTERNWSETRRRAAYLLGTNLAFAREAAGITQAELADRAKTSRATIAQIESGDGDPRLSTLVAIAEALFVSPCVLLLGRIDISAFVELARSRGDWATSTGDDKDIEMLDELSSSPVVAKRRRAARMARDLASKRGFDGIGAAVGAAIGTVIWPGVGTLVGASLGVAVQAMKSGGVIGPSSENQPRTNPIANQTNQQREKHNKK